MTSEDYWIFKSDPLEDMLMDFVAKHNLLVELLSGEREEVTQYDILELQNRYRKLHGDDIKKRF